jgi:hypothetical protein
MSIAAEDWDDLSVARRKRGQRQEAEAAAATETEAAPAAGPRPRPKTVALNAAQQAVITYADDDDEELVYGYGDTENLRPVLSVAGGNIAIWALMHVGVVVNVISATFAADLIGLTFAVSIGLLLASYLMREWHRDREALICLVGGLPLPLTIISLLT